MADSPTFDRTPTSASQPESLLEPYTDVYRYLVKVSAQVRVALWAWDAEEARRLISRARSLHSEVIDLAIDTAKDADRLIALNVEQRDSDALKVERRELAMSAEDMAAYMLSGPASVLAHIQERVETFEGQPSDDVSTDFRYRTVMDLEGRVVVRGYSRTGNFFDIDQLYRGFSKEFDVAPVVLESFRGDKGQSEFSTSFRVLVSPTASTEEVREADAHYGLLEIAVHDDMLEALFIPIDSIKDPSPVVERIAAVAADALSLP